MRILCREETEQAPGGKAREPEENWEDAGAEPARDREADGAHGFLGAGPGVQ